MTDVEKILYSKGPMISSDLASLLSKELGIPVNTASQKISRDKKLKKIKGFFTSNQSLIFLEDQYRDGKLYEALSKALRKHGRKYWYCLNAINMHGGIINTKFLECYTNYPIQPLKKHFPFEVIMRKFVSNGILVFNNTEYSFAPKFAPLNTTNLTHRTIETIKEDILNHFHEMLRNLGMISYNTGELFSEYGKFRWSFKGVSYLRGLVVDKKPGFILADILFGKEIKKEDVEFFLEKLNHIQSFKNTSKVIPFLIVDDLHKDALEELKKNGVAIGLIKELFGEKYALALKELVSVLNNAGASLKTQPNKYLELIEELKLYNETLIYNIRGTLFEYFVGHLHSKKSQSIDIGREIIENNGKHEIDVFAIYSDRVVFAECKATNSKIELDKIKNWTDKKIPAFRKWLLKQETLKDHKIEFEYWATGGFTKDALNKLTLSSTATSKYSITFFQGNDIRTKAIGMKNKKLREAVDNYFLKRLV